jgi:hypothetical protein
LFFVSVLCNASCCETKNRGRVSNGVSIHFVEHTRVVMSEYNSYSSIKQLALAARDHKINYVRTYDSSTGKFVDKRIRTAGASQTNCYCILSFDQDHTHDVACTPSQKFYRISDRRWVEAYMLGEGDLLLGDHNQSIELKTIQLINKPLKVYVVEVKRTHTFLVGFYRLVTHNMFIPVAASLGINVPFGIGCGGATGSVLGPIGIVGGVVLGGVLGCVLGATLKERFADYTLSFKVDAIESILCNAKQEAQPNNSSEEKASEESSEKNKADSKEAKLPKEGSFPFIPPKIKDGKIPKNKSGAYIDSKGNEWRWDNRKSEWDVSNKWGHRNVNSQGYETHRGTHPGSGSDTSKSKKTGK